MTRTITLPTLHPAQREIAESKARFRVAACGRRFGKTLLASGEAMIEATRGGRVWWVAPSYDVTKRGWEMLNTLARQIPGVEIRRGDREVWFPGGGFVAMKTADTKAGLLGEGLDFVVIDECAYVLESVWIDDLRPTLSDRLGRALFISRPVGRNWFWRAFNRGQDPAYGDWESWQRPTSDNPYILASEIEAARNELPELNFRQSYLAEFLSGEGQVFRRIRECVTKDAPPEPYQGEFIAGVDWAQQHDFTVIAVMDRSTRKMVDYDRFNQVSWAVQRGRLAAMVEKWGIGEVVAESNSIGGPNIEALIFEGMPVTPFETTAKSKPQLIESLVLAFEQGEISILDDRVLIGELEAYERTVSSTTGRPRYNAPDGMHDDFVIALALANHACVHGFEVLFEL